MSALPKLISRFAAMLMKILAEYVCMCTWIAYSKIYMKVQRSENIQDSPWKKENVDIFLYHIWRHHKFS